VSDQASLDGQVAVVTGGNGGIGLAIAAELAGAGSAVAIWGRSVQKNEAATASLAGQGAEVLATACDVSSAAGVAAATAEVMDRFGRIDVCFANAGIGGSGGILDMPLEEWHRVLSVNLDGTFLAVQHCARAMVEGGEGGAIVMLSSTSAMYGAPRFPHYAASKAGVLGLMRSVAVDLAPHKIRVNALLPGWTTTDMTQSGYESERFRKATTKRTPVGRWAAPGEIGRAAMFLADRSHVFHTGQTLVVDGGYTIF